ncbi:hypothetical protein O3M35_000388 [Rhynocoris fuscipes]|uniref:Uncharacterized protein n=1 Tax=Rhynocoris fuscipes TaxID=488301 RepID=A0AAW1DQ01_9HEMI
MPERTEDVGGGTNKCCQNCELKLGNKSIKPKTSNGKGTHKLKCGECNECPKCKRTLGQRPPSSATLIDFKVTSSDLTSKEIKDVEKKDEKEEAEKCVRDTRREEKEDPLVKWFPDHIEKDPLKHPLVPYPNPAPVVELRGGNFIHFCHCLKRNGLQSDCPLTGCQGGRDCMQRFLPDCVPSGLRLPGKPPAYIQKANEPECYNKTELAKGYDKIINETITGGTGGIEGDKEEKQKKVDKSKGVVIIRPPSITSLMSDHSKEEEEDDTKKKRVRIRPNSPPNYISEPAVDALPAPCRRHATRGIPGSGKYNKFARCRLRKGKTTPKVIVPPKK